jgi:hypothetical protein
VSVSKAALVIDVRNMYNMIGRKYANRALAYAELVKILENKLNLKFMHKIAYMMQSESANSQDTSRFTNFLHSTGFEVHVGMNVWNIEMALRCTDILPSVDTLCLGTNYTEHGRILRYAREKGKFTYAVGVDFPPRFATVADLFEIPIELTKVKNDKQLELPTESSKPSSDSPAS